MEPNETEDHLEGAEAKLDAWKRLIVSALGLGQPALDRPRSQLEMRGKKRLPKASPNTRPSFAQLAVPLRFVEALGHYFTAAGCEVRVGQRRIGGEQGSSVPLTVWQQRAEEQSA